MAATGMLISDQPEIVPLLSDDRQSGPERRDTTVVDKSGAPVKDHEKRSRKFWGLWTSSSLIGLGSHGHTTLVRTSRRAGVTTSDYVAPTCADCSKDLSEGKPYWLPIKGDAKKKESTEGMAEAQKGIYPSMLSIEVDLYPKTKVPCKPARKPNYAVIICPDCLESREAIWKKNRVDRKIPPRFYVD